MIGGFQLYSKVSLISRGEEKEEEVFNTQTWRLLKAIEEKKSLKKAALSLNISYRKAWGDIKKVEKYLASDIVKISRGGKNGGETILTSFGKKWLRAYARFQKNSKLRVERSYQSFLKEITSIG